MEAGDNWQEDKVTEGEPEIDQNLGIKPQEICIHEDKEGFVVHSHQRLADQCSNC